MREFAACAIAQAGKAIALAGAWIAEQGEALLDEPPTIMVTIHGETGELDRAIDEARQLSRSIGRQIGRQPPRHG